MYIEENGVNETVNVGDSSLMSKILFFGGLSFIIEGVTNLIPIRSTMIRPFLFPKLMRWALSGIFILICAMGILIPVALGDDTPDLIMLSYQSDHMWIIIPNLIFVVVKHMHFGLIFGFESRAPFSSSLST